MRNDKLELYPWIPLNPHESFLFFDSFVPFLPWTSLWTQTKGEGYERGHTWKKKKFSLFQEEMVLREQMVVCDSKWEAWAIKSISFLFLF